MLEGADDALDVDPARPERREEPVDDGLSEGHLAGPNPLGRDGVDVLEVDVEDPLGRQPRDGDRVRASQVEMTGVKAQPDIGRLEESLDVVSVLDGHAPMRVEGRLEAGIGDEVLEPSQVGEEDGPVGLAHVEGRVVARVVRGRTEHEHGRSGGRELARGASHVLQLRLDLVGTIEEGRHEAADHAQVVARDVFAKLPGVGRQVAVGPELRGVEPGLGHLRQDTVPIHEIAPARGFVHAPGDRRTREAVEQVAHDPPQLS